MEVNESEISKYIPGVRKKLEWLSEEDLLKRVLSLEFNRLLTYYQNMPGIDLDEKDKKEKRDRKGERGEKGDRGKRGDRKDKDRRKGEDGYERLMVNIGKSAGFFPGNLMELVNKNVAGPKPEIGRIDLMPGYTLFDVRKGDSKRVLDALRHAEFFGDRIHAEVAEEGRDYASIGAGKSRYSGKKGKFAGKEKREGKKKDKGEKKDKKEEKERKPKGDKNEFSKPKYNGNYDIFINK